MNKKIQPISSPENKKNPFKNKKSDDHWNNNPEIIKSFLDARPEFEQLCAEVEYILRKKIINASIETSFIGSRAKTLKSFLEKLDRKNYISPLTQLTDFAGARVVCLYNSDIPKVIEIIRSEFNIIEETKKLDELGTNKFGYIGHHFIVTLGRNSSGARYDDLKSLRCEIQVRTVVQDAWSIIQHHMVYKKESQVPSDLIRKLNGLAALFETVDDQFELIKAQRDNYLDIVRESQNAPSEFLEYEINFDSFIEYLKWRYPDSDPRASDENTATVFDALTEAKFLNLKELNEFITTQKPFIESSISIKYNSQNKKDLEQIISDFHPAVLVAVALAADPRFRSLIPWGESWIQAFESASQNS